MNLRRIAAACLSVVTLAALSGCAGGAGPGSGPVTLTFQSLAFLPKSQTAVQKIVADFNAERDDVNVELIQGSWDSVQDQLTTQFAGGTAPDIVHNESANLAGFAKDGYLADLSAGVDPAVRSAIPQGVWDAVTVDGKIIAAPTLMQSYLVFANTDLLKEAGVEVPDGELSWDQLADLATKIKNETGKPGLGWGLKNPTAAIMNLGLGFGGDFFAGSGTDATIEVGPAELEVPTRIAAMAAEGSLDPATLTQTGSEVLPGWYAGNYAMTVQGSFQAGAFVTDAPDGFNWTALPVLAGTVDAGQAANPQTLSVSADSENFELATEFVSYFVEAENLAAVAEGETLFPTLPAAQDKVLADTGGDNGWAEIIASGKNLRKAPFQSADGYPRWRDQTATPAFQQFFAGRIDETGLQTQLTEGWAAATR